LDWSYGSGIGDGFEVIFEVESHLASSGKLGEFPVF
jgi:hypothetical protein